ncbi:hypothetical protein [Xanthomonas axonopodis]|uniref:hypothetical protein n=1 Tax=Xanthomonas axonopodis TaxID=53413 RepID=UPI0010707FF1|nr:hypothetical protein XAV_15100 [Xanthomonas axonopodis pv. vasculorum]
MGKKFTANRSPSLFAEHDLQALRRWLTAMDGFPVAALVGRVRVLPAPSCRYGPGARLAPVDFDKTNLTALALMRYLGVKYKPAWRVKYKIRQVIAQREAVYARSCKSAPNVGAADTVHVMPL